MTITYDGDGNRVQKIANGATTRYLVDDLNPTGYAQVVEETGATQRTYTYGLQRIDENQIINSAWMLSEARGRASDSPPLYGCHRYAH